MDLSSLQIGDGVRRRLEAAVGRLSHAYIIADPSAGKGKALAQLLAQAYVCSAKGDRPCGVCSDCRKAGGNIHPDVIRVSIPEDKRSILVDQVRAMRADAYIRPNEADRKVFIIEDAQTMNDSAQNALLKVLEDGPAYTAFLLLTEYPQQLLPTIRSRCETLSLVTRPGVESPDTQEELRKVAVELADLLVKGDELALAEYTVTLEGKKWERDSLVSVLTLTEDILRERLQKQPRTILPLLEHLRQVRQATRFHVGSGHLLGWLAVGP